MERGSGRTRQPSVPLKTSWRSLSAAAALAALFLVFILGVAGPAASSGPAYGAFAPSAENGTITVDSTPDGAPFSIEGPQAYSGEAPWTFNEAPAGEYTITWLDMDGRITPAGQTGNLAGGGSINFNGVYEQEEPPPPETGTITVDSTPDGALFSIEGPQDYSGEAPWTFNEAPAGEYTMTWLDMDGRITPAGQTRNLAGGGSINFNGVYEQEEPPPPQTGTIVVTASVAGATFSITGAATYSGAPQTIGNAPAGEYTISWGEVTGYTRPASQARTLTPGGTIFFSGNYVATPVQAGTITVTSNPLGAPFTITGAVTYSGATPRTYVNAPPGSYTITWGVMLGLTTPVSETRILTESGGITFTGNYGADAAGPVISGVTATSPTADGATITWTTDEPATGQVRYGPSTNYGPPTPLNSTLTTGHSVALTGLVFGTLYHYQVISSDALGNSTTSGDYTFTTIDNMPPATTGVTVTDITPTSCNITWTTSEEADSQVEYGLDVTYGFITTPDTAMVTSHRVALTGLSPGKWYNCRVLSRDAAGNLAQSDRYEFLTSDDTPPAISGVTVIDITASSVTITWVTDERADSQVEYGLTANYGSSSTVDSTLVYDHLVVLTGLASQTTYHYRVKSTDYWANSTQSPDAAVPTTDITAPQITRVAATGITDSSAIIVWTTDAPSESSVEYGISTTYGFVSAFDNTLVTSHSVALADLAAQTTYHYKVKSRDASGLWAETPDGTFTTGIDMGADPPKILFLTPGEPTNSAAAISWSTNEPATSQVEYGLTDKYGFATAPGTEFKTAHLVPVTDLKAGMTYHYRVISTDAAGNRAVSDDKTFNTPMGRAPLPSLPAWAWAVIGVAGAMVVGVLVVKNR